MAEGGGGRSVLSIVEQKAADTWIYGVYGDGAFVFCNGHGVSSRFAYFSSKVCAVIHYGLGLFYLVLFVALRPKETFQGKG